MGSYIVKLKDRYVEWSTVCDAPVSDGMTRDGIKSGFIGRYGPDPNLDEYLALADKYGASYPDLNWRTYNRAGPHETFVNEDELYQVFCLGLDLDPATVQRKLREQAEEIESSKREAKPLSDSPTDEEIKAAFDALEWGMTIAEVETILGKVEVQRKKRRRDLVARWHFERIVVTCYFNKTDGKLSGRMTTGNYKSKGSSGQDKLT
jgi:hypothetical protein